MKKILFINSFEKPSGSEKSLCQLLEKLPPDRFLKYTWGVSVFSDSCISICRKPLPLIVKTTNPVRLVSTIIRTAYYSLLILFYCKKLGVHMVHANNFKSVIYGLLVCAFTKVNLVWHVRDNLKKNIIERIAQRVSKRIVCISYHIHGQFKGNERKLEMIYGGIDTELWKPSGIMKSGIEDFSLTEGSLCVSMVCQLTPWKNCQDFIDAAKIICERVSNIQFMLRSITIVHYKSLTFCHLILFLHSN